MSRSRNSNSCWPTPKVHRERSCLMFALRFTDARCSGRLATTVRSCVSSSARVFDARAAWRGQPVPSPWCTTFNTSVPTFEFGRTLVDAAAWLPRDICSSLVLQYIVSDDSKVTRAITSIIMTRYDHCTRQTRPLHACLRDRNHV